MEDDNIDFNREMLHDIVSSSIFSHNMKTATVDLDDQIPPETMSKPYIDVHYGQDLPSLNELDTHTDTLLLECSKQFDEDELRQHTSKHIKTGYLLEELTLQESISTPKSHEK